MCFTKDVYCGRVGRSYLVLDILISFLADFIFVVIPTGLFGMVEQNILMILEFAHKSDGRKLLKGNMTSNVSFSH